MIAVKGLSLFMMAQVQPRFVDVKISALQCGKFVVVVTAIGLPNFLPRGPH